jgi:WD40 repeat protein
MCSIHRTKELGTLCTTQFLDMRLTLFVPQFVSGSDDFQLRVYNISTGERVTSFEAHPDYIRCMTVHPTLSLVLTGSDDMTIKAWDWDKGWRCVQVCRQGTGNISPND